MAALPGPEWSSEPLQARPTLGRVRHVFTHFALDLSIVASDELPEHGWWEPIDRLGEAGLPTLYRRAVEAVLAGKERLAA
jgi:A/G-specific adenine glycosylase